MGVRLGRNTCFCLKVCFREINVVGIQNEFHSVLEFSSLIHSINSVTWYVCLIKIAGRRFECLTVKSNKSNDIY